jgi:hypothetical protein
MKIVIMNMMMVKKEIEEKRNSRKLWVKWD